MKNLSRRHFIFRLCLTGGGILLPYIKIKGAVSDEKLLSKQIDNELIDIQKVYRQAKETFYKKEYPQAEIIFKQLIEQDPECIEFYDGLKKTYLAQQKLLEACRLMQAASQRFSKNVLFLERYAKMLMRVAMGNKSAKEAYMAETQFPDLFVKAVSLYCEVIKQAPQKEYLRFALLDALSDIKIYNRVERMSVDLPDDLYLETQSLTEAYYEKWLHYKAPSPRKKSVQSFAVDKVTEKRALYFIHEQQQWMLQHLKNEQKKQMELYEELRPVPGQQKGFLYPVPNDISLISRELLTLIHVDAHALEDYSLLYAVTKKRYTKYPFFWTCIAFANTARLRRKNYWEEAETLYRQAERKVMPVDNKKVNALYGGLARCYYDQNRYEEGQREILKGLDLIYGTGGGALALILLYADGYRGMGEYAEAVRVLVGLATKYEVPQFRSSALPKDEPVRRFLFPDSSIDKNLYFIQQLRKKNYSNSDKVTICYALANIYRLQGDMERVERLRSIVQSLCPGIQCF